MKTKKMRARVAWRGLEALEPRLLLSGGSFTAVLPLTIVDPETGNTAVFSMKGPGTGAVTESVNSLWDLQLTGTNRTSKVTITGAVDLESIDALKMIGGITASHVDLVALNSATVADSFLDFQGGILSLTMQDVTAVTPLNGVAQQVTIDNGDFASDAVTLQFRNINDMALTSKMPIASLTAASYVIHNTTGSSDTVDFYTVVYVGAISITGDVGRRA